MADQPTEAALSMPVSSALEAAAGSALAEEVVSLFDQLRDRLLRYVLSFGLPIQDAEDVVQEVFLSLFRQLATRAITEQSSRVALQGWSQPGAKTTQSDAGWPSDAYR